MFSTAELQSENGVQKIQNIGFIFCNFHGSIIKKFSLQKLLPCQSKKLFLLVWLQTLLKLCITEINSDVKGAVNFITRMYWCIV